MHAKRAAAIYNPPGSGGHPIATHLFEFHSQTHSLFAPFPINHTVSHVKASRGDKVAGSKLLGAEGTCSERPQAVLIHRVLQRNTSRSAPTSNQLTKKLRAFVLKKNLPMQFPDVLLQTMQTQMLLLIISPPPIQSNHNSYLPINSTTPNRTCNHFFESRKRRSVWQRPTNSAKR